MSDAAVEAAHAFLRGHTTGDLRFDEHVRPVRYVLAPAGALVLPAMVAMLQAVDTVLFVPSLEEGAMEVQLTLVPFGERDAEAPEGAGASPGAITDRWRIHHGDPEDVRWAVGRVDAARYGGNVVDGDAMMRPNPLEADEPALCRWMNMENAEALRDLCRRYGRRRIEAPLMVAVDPLGLDVRGRFEVVRVPFPAVAPTRADVERVLREMMSAAKGADPTRADG